MKYHNISQLIQKAKNNNGGDWSKPKGQAMIINHPNRFPVFSTKTLKKTDWKLQQESSHLQMTKKIKRKVRKQILLPWVGLLYRKKKKKKKKRECSYKLTSKDEEMEETSAFYTPFIGHSSLSFPRLKRLALKTNNYI